MILDILHLGHFGVWYAEDKAVGTISSVLNSHRQSDRRYLQKMCVLCQTSEQTTEASHHPWMMSEEPWCRINADHAIILMGNNWLIMTDAYTKYPSIHQTSSTSTQATTTLPEEDFAHFRIPTYNCVRQCNTVQFYRVPAIVPPARHQTPYWRSLSSTIKPMEPQRGWFSLSSSH